MVRRFLENFVQPLELLLWAAAVLALLAKEPLLSVAIVLVVVVNAVFSFLEEFKGGARDHGDKAERAIMETRRSARSWRQGGARDHGDAVRAHRRSVAAHGARPQPLELELDRVTNIVGRWPCRSAWCSSSSPG
jgi:hypothetical protein